MENKEDVKETSPFFGAKGNVQSAPLAENIDNNPNGKRIFYVVLACLELVAILCFILVLYWTIHYFNGFAWDGTGKEFNLHPVLMVTGMVLFNGNAAIAYRFFRNQNKLKIKVLHGCTQLIVFICAVIGLVAVFDYHNAAKIPNMYSMHSWIGIASVSLFACQLLFGFVGFLYPKFSDDYRQIYLKSHVYFGIVIFALAIAACVTGLTEKMLFSSSYASQWKELKGAGLVANILTISLIVFGMLVSFVVYNPSYKRAADHADYKRTVEYVGLN
ncbi:lysosomal membrane ascorbate-dependent ferrireductase CYB561A3 [Hydra vulgaris]|uniref:lysosomal membrane ascorbate-dependent ferrireductase CYB561A3 n=1 Tax=Hydra vulgaris TaxID=6087 RepID=UPI001F5FC402|nr:lysosomal membrane ascorbate-dependent ferrireductase CYB561A3-like [Hydra vulgaris]